MRRHELRVVVGVIERDDLILVGQRRAGDRFQFKWEFPGGKIEEGEQSRDALRRELEEEIGIDARIGNEVARLQHSYKNGGAVELRFFDVPEYKGEIENRIFNDVQWVERTRLPEFDFLDADLELVKDLAAGKIL